MSTFEYEVEELSPLGRDRWMAKVKLALEEKLGPVGVRQVGRLNLRFTATGGETGDALMAKAHQEARRVLSAFGEALAKHSSEELLEQFYRETDGAHLKD
jgi:hypothetical protein